MMQACSEAAENSRRYKGGAKQQKEETEKEAQQLMKKDQNKIGVKLPQ